MDKDSVHRAASGGQGPAVVARSDPPAPGQEAPPVAARGQQPGAAGAGQPACAARGDPPEGAGLKPEYERWRDETQAEVAKRFPERKPRFETLSGLELERLYTALDAAGRDYLEALGFPGEYPFTRGVQRTMYRGRLWTMRQYAGFGTAEETNRRFKFLLEQGQTGLSVAFDLPTQLGYDSDHPLAEGEVGRVGVAVSSLEDMERLFEGIPLDKVSTSMTINAPAAVLLGMYQAVAEKQGVEPSKLNGTIQNDILKEYTARGNYIFPPQPSMRLVTDTMAYCSRALPNWNSISVSGYHIREAGSTAVQEIAFTLANAIAYVEAAQRAGLGVDDIGPRLSFFFNSHTSFLEEVAKYRAARRLWARIMKERFGAQNPRSMMLRFHTQTAGCTLTAQGPLNNVVRVALQALAAALGGTQSLHTNSFDEALALPSETAALVALRTQQIIGYESGVADTIDPLGGSYCIESLTDRLEAEAQRYIERIDALGGAIRAVETGFIQAEIGQSAYAHQVEVEKGARAVVGVNVFPEPSQAPADLLRVDPQVGRLQAQGLQELRARRSQAEVDAALDAVEEAARGTDNLVPPILEAVRRYATLGEICARLRRVFGEYRPPTGL